MKKKVYFWGIFLWNLLTFIIYKGNMSFRFTTSVWATLAVALNDMEIVIVGATLAVA